MCPGKPGFFLASATMTPIHFQRQFDSRSLTDGLSGTYWVRSEDGSLSLRAATHGRGTAGDTVFVDARSGVPQFAVHPKRKLLNTKYDVLDSQGHVIGRLQHHLGSERPYWSLLDEQGNERAGIVQPDAILKQFLQHTIHGAREAYAFAVGQATFATLTEETAPRQFVRGLKRFLHALLKPRAWVLRLEPDNIANLDPRVVIAGALMMQELTVAPAVAD